MVDEPLKILLVSAEVAPFSKVGGLADAVSGLSKSLKALGHDVRIAVPTPARSGHVGGHRFKRLYAEVPVSLRSGHEEYATVHRAFLPCTSVGSKRTFANAADDIEAALQAMNEDIPVYFVAQKVRSGSKDAPIPDLPNDIYAGSDDPEPLLFFCAAVLEMLGRLRWHPDVIHCNDWHTGMIPVLQKTRYAGVPGIGDAASLFTIHNLAHQGIFSRDAWHLTGLPEGLYRMEGLEFYGRWSFMKGALTFADQVNTVSETYAREIQTEQSGWGLQGLLNFLSSEGRLSGILNGLDNEEFNPRTDAHITSRFDATEPAGKKECKVALQRELGLPVSDEVMTIGWVSRLTDQKGIDLLQEAAEQILELPIQFICLGAGDSKYERFFTEIQSTHPDQVRTKIGYDAEFAQRIYSGCDAFLMPSRFEPCGTAQMIALRYGAVPIVRATGGLAETVVANSLFGRKKGNGFLFSEHTAEALVQAVRSAISLYGDREAWNSLVQRALITDFPWVDAARKYTHLYAAAKSLPRSLPA